MPTAARWRSMGMFLIFILLMLAFEAHAQTQTGVLDDVTDRYQAAASRWAGVITRAATFLFWSLALISMVWTFGLMMMRKADISEFFVELIRFFVFTGFFFWMLTNAPAIATAILNSLKKLGGDAAGTAGLTPSGIVDVGFQVFDKVISNSTIRDIPASLFGMIMAAVILGILAWIAINMVVLLVSGWILAYAGIFFLGFGGSRWTSDIAINYYKTVLAVAGSLMGMVLIVGIGQSVIEEYYARMTTISLKEIGVMFIAALALLLLTNKIPPLIAGIASGGSIGAASSMGVSGGAMMAAGAVAGAAAAGAVSAAMSGATGAAGWGSAVSAAMKAGGTASRSDTGVSSMPGASAGGSGDSSSSSSSSSTPFGAAMGDSGGSMPSAGSGTGFSDSDGSGNGSQAGALAEGGESSQQSDAEGGKAPKDGDFAAAAEGQGAGTGGGRSTLGALAAGIGAVAKSRAGMALDAARERVSQTTGGRVAAEINNPGSANSDRENNADILRSQSTAGKANAARAFMATGQAAGGEPPAFTGDSLSGFNNPEKAVDESAEVSAFANRKPT